MWSLKPPMLPDSLPVLSQPKWLTGPRVPPALPLPLAPVYFLHQECHFLHLCLQKTAPTFKSSPRAHLPSSANVILQQFVSNPPSWK